MTTGKTMKLSTAILKFLEGKGWTRTHEIFDHIDELCDCDPVLEASHAIDAATLRNMVLHKELLRKEHPAGGMIYKIPTGPVTGQMEMFRDEL